MSMNQLPKVEGDYPLWLLLAVKRSLFRVMEDPELEDARAVLQAIDEALIHNPNVPLASAANP